MGIQAGIFNSMVRPPEDPIANYMRLSQLRDMGLQRKRQEQEIKQGDITLKTLAQKQTDDQALRDAYAKAGAAGVQTKVNNGNMNLGGVDVSAGTSTVKGPGVDNGVLLSELSKVAPHMVPQLQEHIAATQAAQQKAAMEQQKLVAETGKISADAQLAKVNIAKQQIERTAAVLATAKDQGSYDAARQQLIAERIPGAEQIPPQFDKNFVDQHVQGAVPILNQITNHQKELELQQTKEIATQHDKTTRRGQDLVNDRAKEANTLGEFRTMSGAEIELAGLPKGTVAQTNGKGKIDVISRPGDKPPTEGERTAFSFYQRATDAAKRLDELEPNVLKAGTTGAVGRAVLPNALMSDVNQQYTQAQRQFTQAKLRRESGAAISQSEYDQDAKTYFPQVGDTQKTLANKKQAREAVLKELKTASGRAYTESFGDGAQPAQASHIGNIHVNPQTGEKIGWDGKAWVKVP